MNTTKKSLWAAGIALLISIALLIGTTFAWFTDSVINKGNVISAGDLKISATAYDVDMSNTSGQSYEIAGVNNGNKIYFEATGQNLKNDSNPIINESLWEPGKSNAKLLTVKNEGSLAAKLSLSFDVNDDGLQGALWFDFIQVGSDGNLVGEFTERPMSELASLGKNREFSLATGQSISFILVYGMNEHAGNDYQGKTFGADVTILAKQDTVEKDGFGSNQYDSESRYESISAESLKADLAAGGSVVLGDDINITPEGNGVDDGSLVPQTTITKDTTMNLSDKTLSLDTSKTNESLPYVPSLIAVNSGTLTLTGEGTINAEAGYNTAYGINVTGGTVVIEDGNYYGAMSAVQVQKGTLIINGGFFDLAPTIKSDAPEYATYLINCIDASYKDGSAIVKIKGGTFVNFDPSNNAAEGAGTNFLADGYKVISEKHGTEIWYTVVPE